MDFLPNEQAEVATAEDSGSPPLSASKVAKQHSVQVLLGSPADCVRATPVEAIAFSLHQAEERRLVEAATEVSDLKA